MMVVRLVDVPVPGGGTPTTLLEMELWRADRTTSVIDLDGRGYMLLSPTVTWQERLYPAHLASGLGGSQLAGKHVSEMIPQLKGNAMIEACRNGKQFEATHLGDHAPVTLHVRSSCPIVAAQLHTFGA